MQEQLASSSTQHDKPASTALQETEKGLFFIVGCGRSGTTLLQVMLDSHSDLALPSETHFFSVLRKRHLNLGNLGSPELMRQAVECILAEEHITPLRLDPHRVQSLVHGQPNSWETLLLALLTAYREKRGVPRVGEKTPAHINHLWRLASAFPDAKFIHLIRDPRAVVNSYIGSRLYEFFGKNPSHAIHMWRRAIEVHREAEQRLDSRRYTTVRYEALVSNPEAELNRICGFLGVGFQPSMLEYYNRDHSGFRAGETHKLGTFKPVYKDSLQNWRASLSRHNRELVDTTLGSLMPTVGYEPESPPSVTRRIQFAYLFAAYRVRVQVFKLLRGAGWLKTRDWGGAAPVDREASDPVAD